MTSNRTTVEARLRRGLNQECAHSHHDRCKGPENCTCACHSDPSYLEKSPAERAHQTRREMGAQARAGGAAAAETAPKRPDIKSAFKPAVPAAVGRQIKSEFSFVLWLADQGAAKAAPKYWQPEDRLTDDERTSLTNATYNEIEARFPKLLKWLAKAQDSAPEAALIYTLAMIAAPRLARHGLIPAELASAIVFAPIILANVQQSATEQPAADVGSVPTPVSDWPDGDGQIDFGGPPVAPATVQTGAPQQTGHGDVRHGAGDSHSAGNGRYAP